MIWLLVLALYGSRFIPFCSTFFVFFACQSELPAERFEPNFCHFFREMMIPMRNKILFLKKMQMKWNRMKFFGNREKKFFSKNLHFPKLKFVFAFSVVFLLFLFFNFWFKQIRMRLQKLNLLAQFVFLQKKVRRKKIKIKIVRNFLFPVHQIYQNYRFFNVCFWNWTIFSNH